MSRVTTTVKSRVVEFIRSITGRSTTEVPILTKSELAEFIDAVGGERTEVYGKSDNEVFSVEPGYVREDSDVIPAEITWKEDRLGKEPKISIKTYGDPSAGVAHTTTAPVSEWRLRQTVDDGNLLTLFETKTSSTGDFEAALSVYGPPPDSAHYDEHLLDTP